MCDVVGTSTRRRGDARRGADCWLGNTTSPRSGRPPASPCHRIAASFRLQYGVFDDLVVLDVTANAFLHHMVRNIAAALMQVGAGDHEPRWMGGVLVARDRALVGPTAPPTGLYLVDVQYGAEFAFPRGGTPMILKAAGDVW